MMRPSHIIYDRHDEEFTACFADPSRMAIAQTWLREDTVDHWRRERLHRLLLPFIETDREARWLTVGDGRFGSDAQYLQRRGVSVHASDNSPQFLKIAASKGLLNEFSQQNAEHLTFADSAFDYVYCKEALHHLPRPHIALHEMFRVARKAVILQEPYERIGLSNAIRMVRGPRQVHEFESVGNYRFRLSRHECEKFLLAMHFRHYAFRGINDAYVEGIEFCPDQGGSPIERATRLRIKSIIAVRNILSAIGIVPYKIVCIVLFKDNPSASLRSALVGESYGVVDLPRNPYLGAATTDT